jgi:hypothetical protein
MMSQVENDVTKTKFQRHDASLEGLRVLEGLQTWRKIELKCGEM